jgi:hypothetical protein
VDALTADSRFALRHFARKPGTTLTMLVVLVAGLTISTLLFTYVYAYAKQPPPGVTLEDDLVRIRGSRTYGGPERGYRTFSEEEFLEHRKLTTHFSAVAGWTDASAALTVGDDAERQRLAARVTFVTENYFSVLADDGLGRSAGPARSACHLHERERAPDGTRDGATARDRHPPVVRCGANSAHPTAPDGERATGYRGAHGCLARAAHRHDVHSGAAVRSWNHVSSDGVQVPRAAAVDPAVTLRSE